MQIEWKKVEGTQETKPAAIDTTSSPLTVYLRKEITQVTKKSGDEEIKVWQYLEAQLTLKQYAEYQKELAECDSMAIKKISEENLIVMGAIADQFDFSMQLAENQLIIMEAIADLYETIEKGGAE